MLGAREVRRPVARGLVLRRHIEADRQLTEFRTRGFHCGRRNLGTQHKAALAVTGLQLDLDIWQD